MNIEAEKAYLKKENVHEHIGKIIDRVVAEKPQDAFSLVEVLSRLVKASAKPPDAEFVQAEAAAAEERTEALTQYFQKARELDKVPRDDGGEVVQVCNVPDFCEEADILSWAGVGFGDVESYKVMCSLRNLAQKEAEGVTKLRFWGKILGTGADYYVAEAARGEGEVPPDEEDMEGPGTPGANLFAYYVTNDLSGTWQRLPEIRPADIRAARKIRRLLTGDASAKVITHPDFGANEAVLLRAQIARITADTMLAIKGFLKREEGDDGPDPDAPIEENPAFALPPPDELAKLDSWTHMTRHILLNGRTEYKELPDDMEEEDKAKIKEEEGADPPRELNRGIVGEELEWVVKQAGDSTVYADPSRSTAVTHVRSITWPGAVCAARGRKFVNVYVGYGLPTKEPDFFPPEPPDVQEEPEDPGEQAQPPGTEEAEEPKEEEG